MPPRLGNRPGPKPRLSRELVIATAVDLGVEQVTIGAVAEALQVAPGSLYRYIDSLDDLVAAALDAVLATEPTPPGDGGWRAYLEAEAWAHWELLRRYAGLVSRYEGRLALSSARRLELLVRDLRGFGFTTDTALVAVDAVLDLIHDGAEQAAKVHDPDAPDGLTAWMRDALTLYPQDLREVVTRIAQDPERHMIRKLAIVLDGIAARVAP